MDFAQSIDGTWICVVHTSEKYASNGFIDGETHQEEFAWYDNLEGVCRAVRDAHTEADLVSSRPHITLELCDERPQIRTEEQAIKTVRELLGLDFDLALNEEALARKGLKPDEPARPDPRTNPHYYTEWEVERHLPPFMIETDAQYGTLYCCCAHEFARQDESIRKLVRFSHWLVDTGNVVRLQSGKLMGPNDIHLDHTKINTLLAEYQEIDCVPQSELTPSDEDVREALYNLCKSDDLQIVLHHARKAGKSFKEQQQGSSSFFGIDLAEQEKRKE